MVLTLGAGSRYVFDIIIHTWPVQGKVGLLFCANNSLVR